MHRKISVMSPPQRSDILHADELGLSAENENSLSLMFIV